MIVFGIGIGLFAPSVTTAGVTAVEAARQSLAGGVVYMFQIAGGAIGLGLSTTIFTVASENELDNRASDAGIRLTDADRNFLNDLLSGTDTPTEVARRFPQIADRLTELTNDAFIAGFNAVFRVDTALALVGLVVAVLFVGGRLRLRRREPVPGEPSA